MISKEKILDACRQLVLIRISTAETAMKEAQAGSNEEEKSSAGDKYETARAMGQLARDMNAKQLVQAQQELKELNKIDLRENSTIRQGSIVETEKATYFIAIGLGVIKVDQTDIIALSPQSPLAKLLLGKQTGDSFAFQQKQVAILQVR
jgi:transcription elongation GreA/GreB family factor